VVDGLVNRIASGVVRKGDKASVSAGSSWVERNVIDRMVNGIAGLAMRLGQQFRQMQTGKLQLYLAYTVLSVLLLLLGLFYFAAK
jgi:NADH-quinone oxidoreductase subunit L